MAIVDKKEARKNKLSGRGYVSRRGGWFLSSLRGVRKILGTIIVVLLIFFLLSGAINQVKTGETFAEYAMDIGQSLAGVFKAFPEGNGFLKWEDGIYFKNADVPDHSAVDKEDLPDVPSGDAINQKIDDIANKGE